LLHGFESVRELQLEGVHMNYFSSLFKTEYKEESYTHHIDI